MTTSGPEPSRFSEGPRPRWSFGNIDCPAAYNAGCDEERRLIRRVDRLETLAERVADKLADARAKLERIQGELYSAYMASGRDW